MFDISSFVIGLCFGIGSMGAFVLISIFRELKKSKVSV